MKLYHHPKGPNIAATFHVKNRAISGVSLAENNQKKCCWQIETTGHLSDLIEQWMCAYCEKKGVFPDLPLDWPLLPPFTRKVLKTLPTIPFGKTVSYSQLAVLSDNPKAVRAAGSGCGRNPFPLIVPCHRVLAVNGLGGFSCGIAIKKILLDFEDIHFQ